jgi:hypothetical protein
MSTSCQIDQPASTRSCIEPACHWSIETLANDYCQAAVCEGKFHSINQMRKDIIINACVPGTSTKQCSISTRSRVVQQRPRHRRSPQSGVNPVSTTLWWAQRRHNFAIPQPHSTWPKTKRNVHRRLCDSNTRSRRNGLSSSRWDRLLSSRPAR